MPPFDVWPEHIVVCNVLVAMSTQWLRAGMAGVPTGLNYGSLPAVLDLLGVEQQDRARVFEDLRVMEGVVLEMKH